MKIHIISMSNAEHRRQLVSDQLQNVLIPWSFVDAATHADERLCLKEASWPIKNGRRLNDAEIGCYSSHYRLIANLAEQADEDVMLVLEDDVILDTNFIADASAIIALANEFNYLRLNGQVLAPGRNVKYLGRHRVVRFKRRVQGTLAYLMNGRTARKLLPHLQDVYYPIDIVLDRYWQHGVPINCVFPFVAIERALPSQLMNRDFGKLQPFDFIRWKIHNQVEKLRCAAAGLML